MASRAATPAGRQRAAARTAGGGRTAGSPGTNTRPAAPAKRNGAQRPATKRPAQKRAPAPARARKRSPARVTSKRRPRPRRPASRREGRGFSLSLPRLGLPRLSVPRLHLPSIAWRQTVVVVLALGAALTAGYFLYLRDSSLVAVTDVEVEGVRSGDRERIIAALTGAGEEMTTLHVETDRLEAAVAGFPTVEGVKADASFPHGLRIQVAERPPATVAQVDGREVPIAADGTLLTGVSASEELDLPVLKLERLPESGKLEGEPLDQALVVGATPEELRPLIEGISYTEDYGVEVTMQGGIPIRFGPGARAEAKWAAAAAVLADPKLASLSYVDVRVPERPAAGGASIASTTD